ncbi:hypothetical protein ILUMI_23119 [Ignelater luminosus]|uniref:BtpA family membrane complex biogenesis protein n=1 Tax=Ignelater luminosus TaxID=2038154 RepID=A0A8K0CF81_IGNLU|nr:hypothetical protein ILUMI_23119 [Ignelater luminosus]
MVHAAAFPGAPCYGGSIQKIISKACKETEIYLNNQVDGILVENMHDIPYIQSKHFGPETTAIMTRICTEIGKIVPENVPCGIQILTGGNREALAVAKACNFNFIRSEGFVFSHIGDEGLINADAGLILRYRKNIDAEDILIFTDIKKKHSSHSITSDISLIETAKAAEYFLSDGIILTGTSTGSPADMQELNDLKNNSGLPIIIGSGVTCNNVKDYLDAEAFIIGSHFKNNGFWKNDVSHERVKSFMNVLKEIRH